MTKQLIFALMFLTACSTGSDKLRMEKARNEIVQYGT